MPRIIELGPASIEIQLTGLVHFMSLTARLEIPYAAIESVSSEPFHPPLGALRWGGASISFTGIREGHFRSGQNWFFLSFDDVEHAVTIRLNDFIWNGHGYSTVVLGTKLPSRLCHDVEARLPGARRAT